MEKKDGTHRWYMTQPGIEPGYSASSWFWRVATEPGVSHHFVIALERHIQSGNGIAK
jgi:hypothetical protein